MADLSYPIGKPSLPPSIDRAQREQWIAEIADAPAKLRAAVHGLSEEFLNTPYRPGGWTVRQVVHHLPESHMNAYVRFKLALTEDEPIIKPYDEAAWARLPDVASTPIEVSLLLLATLHDRWVRLLRAIGDADFSKRFNHPEMGMVRLDSATGMYAWHGRHHVAHITSLRDRMGWG